MVWRFVDANVVKVVLSAVIPTRDPRDNLASLRRFSYNVTSSFKFCHFVLVLTARIAFFVFAIKSWDVEGGQITVHKLWFYSLDELSTVLYFCICSILASFWAELYHISTNTADSYFSVVRPLIWVVNIIALTGVPFCSFAVSKDDETEASLVFVEYTVFVVVIFGIATLVFAVYAYLAAKQLNLAPIQLLTRSNSLFSIRLLGCVCIFALMAKAGIFLVLNGKEISAVSWKSQLFIGVYYVVLDMCPLVAVLLYYRVVESDNQHDDMEAHDNILKSAFADDEVDEYNENYRLLGAGNVGNGMTKEQQYYQQQQFYDHQSNKRSNLLGSNVRAGSRDISSYLNNPKKAAPAAVVDAVIASLSTSNAASQHVAAAASLN